MSILIFGSGGQVGQALVGASGTGSMRVVGLTRSEADITDAASIARAIARHQPRVVVNAAAYTAVDQAEDEADIAFAVNRDGTANLARACTDAGAPLVHLSTDYVFDGQKPSPYRESDQPAPAGVYGKSKLAGEEAVRALCDKHIILRTSWVFSAVGRNFVKTMRRLAREGRKDLSVVDDQRGCPTAAADIAAALLAICTRISQTEDGPWGVYHFCGKPATTWYGFARAILAGQQDIRIKPLTSDQYPTRAVRPANSMLACRKLRRDFGIARPDWRASLQVVLADLT